MSSSKRGMSSSKKSSQSEARGPNGLTMKQESDLKIMKEQLFNQNKKIVQLRSQIEQGRTTYQQVNNNTHLLEKKRQLEIKMIEFKQELMTLQSDFDVKKQIFANNKDYHQSLIQQHQDLSERKLHLEKINRQTKDAGNQIDYLRQQIQDVRKEIGALNDEQERLTSQPFFREDKNKEEFKRIDDV